MAHVRRAKAMFKLVPKNITFIAQRQDIEIAYAKTKHKETCTQSQALQLYPFRHLTADGSQTLLPTQA